MNHSIEHQNIVSWQLAGHGKFRVHINRTGEIELTLCEAQFSACQDFPEKMMNALINAGVITSGNSRASLIFQTSPPARKDGNEAALVRLPDEECSQFLAGRRQQHQIHNGRDTQSHDKDDCNK